MSIGVRTIFRTSLLLSLTLLAAPVQAAPFKGRFIGLFYGEGRGCWGALLIRTKTISWDAGDASCARTSYTIIENDLHTPFQNYDHIVFRLHHLSRSCDTRYVALYYYQSPREVERNSHMPEDGRLYYDWAEAGFTSYAQYRKYPVKSLAEGTKDIDPSVIAYCGELPYLYKPFPFGKPLD